MHNKEKILLSKEQETLLIPLYCKACARKPIFVDEKAQEILKRVEYDFSQLNIPIQTRLTICMRAKQIDVYARAFLNRHLRSVVIHLGCGLDSRCLRVNHNEVEWYDLDLPAVIDLRRKFYEETDRYHLISSSVTDLTWMDPLSVQNRPALVIAEGLLMYLPETEVKALVLKLKEAFPGCSLIFDAFSILTAKRVKAHPSLRKTGAVVQWGLDDPHIIEQWAESIRLQEEWHFTQSEDISKLGWAYRFAFKIAGLFPITQRAHRILYYTL